MSIIALDNQQAAAEVRHPHLHPRGQGFALGDGVKLHQLFAQDQLHLSGAAPPGRDGNVHRAGLAKGAAL